MLDRLENIKSSVSYFLAASLEISVLKADISKIHRIFEAQMNNK